MKARNKFLLGGAVILGAAAYLMATSIRQTGVYYLTPTELSAKIYDGSVVLRDRREGRRARRSRLDRSRSPAAAQMTFKRHRRRAVVSRRLPRHHRPTRSPMASTSCVEGRLGARRHLPRDDAAREVRVALRERAGEISAARPATSGGAAGRVILDR